MTDVNLKFNKPEINVSIDREKPKSLGVSVIDIAQTYNFPSGQRFAIFMKKGSNTSDRTI
jgi:multidrug efflux pump subunit AcrB